MVPGIIREFNDIHTNYQTGCTGVQNNARQAFLPDDAAYMSNSATTGQTVCRGAMSKEAWEDVKHTCWSNPNAVDLSVITDLADFTARTNSFKGASKLLTNCSDCFCIPVIKVHEPHITQRSFSWYRYQHALITAKLASTSHTSAGNGVILLCTGSLLCRMSVQHHATLLDISSRLCKRQLT